MDAPKFKVGINVVATIENNHHLGVVSGGYTQDNEWWYHIYDGNNTLYAKETDIIFFFNDKEWVNTKNNGSVSNIYADPTQVQS